MSKIKLGAPKQQPHQDVGKPMEPIRRRKLSHEVLDRLLARIHSGEFPVGRLLPSERILMERFSVGRPAIREALQALERMRLVSIVHGEGARVLPITADSVIGQISDMALHLLNKDEAMLENLKQARLFFETGMVRAVCSEASSSALARIRMALDENRLALNDRSAFLATDMAFHRAIAEATGNPIYLAVSKAMLEWIDKFYSQLVRNPGAERVVLEEHERIFAAIEARDADAAEAAMKSHLLRSNEFHRRSMNANRP